MKKHVDLVGTLYLISGALNLLIGLSMLSLAIGATALAAANEHRPAGLTLTAGIFVTVATLALMCAVAHLWTGMALRRYRRWARAVGIVLATLDLFVLPFGTALGIFALWVLLSEHTRALFEPART